MKEKGKVKGMLNFFKHESPSAIQDERRRDAVERSDDLPGGDRSVGDVTPNQLGEGDHKPQTALYKAAPHVLKAKSKGMYKFFSQNQSLGPGQGSKDGCESLDILDAAVNLHELADGYGNIEAGCEIGGRHNLAFGTDLEIFRANEQSSWNLHPKPEDFSESTALAEDDEICCHQPELPSSPLEANVEFISTSEYQRCEPSSKVEVGEVDTKEHIVTTRQQSNQQPSQPEGKSRGQGVTTFVKRAFELPLKPDEEARGLSLPTPGKRNRQSASKTGQLSIAKFFRTQDRT